VGLLSFYLIKLYGAIRIKFLVTKCGDFAVIHEVRGKKAVAQLVEALR
jgi:hypothetical protein